ncbi:hypothetical protein TNIN_443031 [Trichonephila inaurata madagascariensis]|uniref:Uncharacterized protein n=1 Tax=Trichonephila inaurata madagascariensis TaxID=2747483 RepID=A0A8X7BPD3_9ARAC|nr:hypothetical protein TNIN_443031 [Trichonephila inaurata madagascariensis]
MASSLKCRSVRKTMKDRIERNTSSERSFRVLSESSLVFPSHPDPTRGRDSHLDYANNALEQSQTRVKLERVFFPR